MNYILFGNQNPRIKARLNEIIKERLPEVTEFSLIKYDLKEDKETYKDALIEIQSMPMFIERKLVVIDNADFINDDKEVDKLFATTLIDDDSVDVIFIIHEDKLNQKSETYNNVATTGKVLRLIIEDKDWPLYVRKYFTKYNVKIDNNAVDELIVRSEKDLTRFLNEANKLILYTDHVQLVDVLNMVSKPLEDNAFELTNALIRKNNALALSIYRDLKLQGTKMTDSLIPLIANQFRQINIVRFLYNKGYSNNDIMGILNIKSEYRVRKLIENGRSLSFKIISNALNDLYALDYKSKAGLVDRTYGLELFLIKFPA